MKKVAPKNTTPNPRIAAGALAQSTSVPPSGVNGAVPMIAARAAPRAVAIHLAVALACVVASAQYLSAVVTDDELGVDPAPVLSPSLAGGVGT